MMKKLLLLLSLFTVTLSYAQVTAVNDVANTNQNTSVIINLIANDLGATALYNTFGDPVSLITNGTVIDGPGYGEVTYTPNINFSGTETFDYLITNGTNFDNGQVTVTVNAAPVIISSPQTTIANTPVTICPAVSDADDPVANLSLLSLYQITNGVITGPDASGCFIYTPNTNFSGADTAYFLVCDPGGLCDTATFPITITSLNQAPVAVDDNATTLINITTVVDILANDTDDSNIDATSVNIVSGATNGILSVDATTGQITYTPNQNFIGTETITYTVCDDGQPSSTILCSNTATVTIVVSPLNVQGNLMSSSATPLQNSTVILVEQNGNLLIASQTTTTDAAGFYQFYNVPATFYIKAVPNISLYPSDLPTYYLNSGVFQYATAITPTVSPFVANFNTAAGLNPGGVGFIQGFVGAGAGKNSAEGDAVVDLEVVLVNASLGIVAQTKTDNQGNFEFTNLEAADYYIWVDNGSVNNANAPLISLTTEASQADLKFILEEDALEVNKTTSIKDLSESSFKMYPNPSNGIINISSSELSSSFTIEIVSVQGQKVYSNTFHNNNVSINVKEKGLSYGTYFLKLNTEDGSFYSKIILN